MSLSSNSLRVLEGRRRSSSANAADAGEEARSEQRCELRSEQREEESLMRNVTLLAVLAAAALLAMPVSADEFGCYDVEEIDPGATGPVPGSPYFEGAFTVSIGGVPYTIYSKSLNFGSLLAPDVEGALDVNRIMHRWHVLENGERMNTFDTGVIRATDDPNLLDISIHTTVVGGSRWDQGELILVGVVDVTVPEYRGISIRGVICDSDRLDEDDD